MKNEPLWVFGGIAAVVLVFLFTQSQGSGGGNTTITSSLDPQTAATIAQENEAANSTAASLTLGLAQISGALATTSANNRAALQNAKIAGANADTLAQINNAATLTSQQIAAGEVLGVTQSNNATQTAISNNNADVQYASFNAAENIAGQNDTAAEHIANTQANAQVAAAQAQASAQKSNGIFGALGSVLGAAIPFL